MKEMRSRGRDLGESELRLDANPFQGRSTPSPQSVESRSTVQSMSTWDACT